MQSKKEFVGNKEDYKLAKQFAEEIKKEAPDLVKAVILFGSATKPSIDEELYSKDIDVLIIVNDQLFILNKEVITAYRIIVEKIAAQISKRFHINNIKLTEFMDFVRNGDPVAINMLRDGIPIIDNGFFKPLKTLLDMGQVKPSEENVWVYYMRAPQTIQSAKWHVLQACIDLYWAVVDAGHAALLVIGKTPYHPKHLSKMMRKEIINRGLMPSRNAKIIDKYAKLTDDIVKRKIRHISGKEYDAYQREVKQFIDDMKMFITHHQDKVYAEKVKNL